MELPIAVSLGENLRHIKMTWLPYIAEANYCLIWDTPHLLCYMQDSKGYWINSEFKDLSCLQEPLYKGEGVSEGFF